MCVFGVCVCVCVCVCVVRMCVVRVCVVRCVVCVCVCVTYTDALVPLCLLSALLNTSTRS